MASQKSKAWLALHIPSNDDSPDNYSASQALVILLDNYLNRRESPEVAAQLFECIITSQENFGQLLKDQDQWTIFYDAWCLVPGSGRSRWMSRDSRSTRDSSERSLKIGCF